jgi:hypothetical protein
MKQSGFPRQDVPAASTTNDTLFAARAALKLAARQRRDAEAQFDHLSQLIDRLEKDNSVPGASRD